MTGSTASASPAPTAGEGKGLAAGTLGLWGSTVIGLASTAPAYPKLRGFYSKPGDQPGRLNEFN